MPTLHEQLADADKRRKVIDDACNVLDEEVASKGGLTGIAIKGAYKVVQGVKPGFVREAVDGLLDDFLTAMNPIYQEAVEKKRPVGAYINENAPRVADALLAVTDGKAERAKRPVIKSAYEKLRPMAKKQVEAACPRVGALVERHASA